MNYRVIYGHLIKRADAKRAEDLKEFFEMLGLSGDPGMSTVRRKWKTMISEAHPDRGGSQEDAKKINNAYNAIKLYEKDPMQFARDFHKTPRYQNRYQAEGEEAPKYQWGAGPSKPKSYQHIDVESMSPEDIFAAVAGGDADPEQQGIREKVKGYIIKSIREPVTNMILRKALDKGLVVLTDPEVFKEIERVIDANPNKIATLVEQGILSADNEDVQARVTAHALKSPYSALEFARAGLIKEVSPELLNVILEKLESDPNDILLFFRARLLPPRNPKVKALVLKLIKMKPSFARVAVANSMIREDDQDLMLTMLEIKRPKLHKALMATRNFTQSLRKILSDPNVQQVIADALRS